MWFYWNNWNDCPRIIRLLSIINIRNYNLLVKECINKFHQDIYALIYLLTFFIGMVFGLLTLSKLISWLFKKYRNETLTIIAVSGFILASLIFIWPVRSTESTALLEIVSPIKRIKSQWQFKFIYK